MKKFLLIFMLLIVSCDNSVQVENSISGQLIKIGNEPFIKPALLVKGEIYILVSNPENINELIKTSFQEIKIYYTSIDDNLITFNRYELIEKSIGSLEINVTID